MFELCIKGTAKIPGVQNWFILALTLIIYGVGFFLISIIRRGKVFEIRKMPALDAIDEAVGRSTEMNKKVLFIPGMQTQPGSQLAVAVAGVFGYVTRLTAKTNTGLFVAFTQGEYTLASWFADVAQTTYTEEGHPERFKKEEMFGFLGDAHAWVISLLGWIAENRPGSLIQVGAAAGQTRMRVPEEATRYGALSIVGFQNEIEFVVFYDYFMMSEEVLAAGAYVTKDKILLGSLVTGDVLKYGLLGFLVIIAIVEATGAKIVSQLLTLLV